MVGKKPEPKRDWPKERVAEVVLHHLQQILRAHGMYEHRKKDQLFTSVEHLVDTLFAHNKTILFPLAERIPFPGEKKK